MHTKRHFIPSSIWVKWPLLLVTEDGGIINQCALECKNRANKDTKMALTTIIHLSLDMLMDGEVNASFGQLPVSALGSHVEP